MVELNTLRAVMDRVAELSAFSRFTVWGAGLAEKKRLKGKEREISEAIHQAVTWLNRSPLGCKVRRVKADKIYDYVDRRYRGPKEFTNIQGTAKDGRSIYIQYMRNVRFARPRKKKRKFMQEMEKLGAIVGTAYNYSDVWEIIEGKSRNPRTFYYREAKGEEDGTTEKKHWSTRIELPETARVWKRRDDAPGKDPGNEDPNPEPRAGDGSDTSENNGGA